jgi:hypothetical protein
MHRFAIALIAAASFTVLGGCEDPVVVKFCLSNEGTSQDCGIACNTTKDKRTCDKWAEQTKTLCGKITKAECQEVCDKDKNPTACEIVKTMK